MVGKILGGGGNCPPPPAAPRVPSAMIGDDSVLRFGVHFCALAQLICVYINMHTCKHIIANIDLACSHTVHELLTCF